MVYLWYPLWSANTTKENSEIRSKTEHPNVLIILADQWRAQATGYAGDPNVQTPNLDKLAAGSVNFTNAVSSMPVCTPFRASLLTGQRPLTNGVFMNDVQLDTHAVSMGKVFSRAGTIQAISANGIWTVMAGCLLSHREKEDRALIFGWPMNVRTITINPCIIKMTTRPEEYGTAMTLFPRPMPPLIIWIKERKRQIHFLMVLSWGTPHAPYHTAPEKYRKRFDPEQIKLRDNVPEEMKEQVRKDLAGYYAHIAALDDMIGKLMDHLKETGQLENTIILFTSDHGDLLGSQGAYKKQQPYDESIRVPMLYRIPEGMDIASGERGALIGSADIMPTSIGTLQHSRSPICGRYRIQTLYGGKPKSRYGSVDLLRTALSGNGTRVQNNAREYRGLRTLNYTYTRDLKGPWLLFDNKKDPYPREQCGPQCRV